LNCSEVSPTSPPVTLRDDDITVRGNDDDILRGIGIDSRILYTPGHRKDSITVLLDDGSAFVGDLAFNLAPFAGKKY
jgi:glyoxylase-like metal-dependent hydrolase (beta-lactamase superfamily II)